MGFDFFCWKCYRNLRPENWIRLVRTAKSSRKWKFTNSNFYHKNVWRTILDEKFGRTRFSIFFIFVTNLPSQSLPKILELVKNFGACQKFYHHLKIFKNFLKFGAFEKSERIFFVKIWRFSKIVKNLRFSRICQNLEIFKNLSIFGDIQKFVNIWTFSKIWRFSKICQYLENFSKNMSQFFCRNFPNSWSSLYGFRGVILPVTCRGRWHNGRPLLAAKRCLDDRLLVINRLFKKVKTSPLWRRFFRRDQTSVQFWPPK